MNVFYLNVKVMLVASGSAREPLYDHNLVPVLTRPHGALIHSPVPC